jgi:gamma-glutamyltranspeptidase/glutathione hydrolase
VSSRGIVAAGHPLTAEAGAWALREGGNAVDAAVAAVMASFAAESPLTGLGAGGYMLTSEPGRAPELLDFFVEMPGREGAEPEADLVPLPVYFTDAVPQVFNVGVASNGIYGTPAGLEEALGRSGSMELEQLARPAIAAAREGVVVNEQQAFVHRILEPILTREEACRALYAPEGRILGVGDTIRNPELATSLELFAAEGAGPFYAGAIGRLISGYVLDRGGTIALSDLAAYRTVVREPVRARFRGREILTNPPPASGGILIALALEILERLGGAGAAELVGAMTEAQAARDEDFITGLADDGFAEGFLAGPRLDDAAERVRKALETAAAASGDRLGSTTHITAVDGEGRCAAVTCSNGSSSGVVVPGTGIQLNNMLGEQDLNQAGFHRAPVGSRIPSMMSPTLIMRDGELEAGIGSAGSNRIRSAVLQTITGIVAGGLDAQAAIDASRLHFEDGVVHAEPGIDPAALGALEKIGVPIERWSERNLFFGGVQAVVRDPASGELSGGGDPRRGGAVAYA